MNKVDYESALADMKVNMETQQHKSIMKLEKKFAEKESRLQKKHEDAFASLEKSMRKIVTRMQEAHEIKLGTQMKIDIDQHVEEKRVENEEYIGTTTRKMEAN